MKELLERFNTRIDDLNQYRNKPSFIDVLCKILEHSLQTDKNIRSFNPFKKGEKLYSILHLKCPRCQEGDLFMVKNPYRLKYLDKMPHYCAKCGEDLRREVGFYYGAMIISHASTTVIAVIVHLIVFSFYGWAILPNLLSLLSILLLSFPLVFRSSRAIWLNVFTKYDPNCLIKSTVDEKSNSTIKES